MSKAGGGPERRRQRQRQRDWNVSHDSRYMHVDGCLEWIGGHRDECIQDSVHCFAAVFSLWSLMKKKAMVAVWMRQTTSPLPPFFSSISSFPISFYHTFPFCTPFPLSLATGNSLSAYLLFCSERKVSNTTKIIFLIRKTSF